MKIDELKDFIAIADICGHVPLVRALHGVGKSASCVQYSLENNLHYEPLILSLMDTGDMLGLPDKTELSGMDATTWAAPTWYTNIVNAAWPTELLFERLQFHDTNFQEYVVENIQDRVITRATLNDLYCAYYNVPKDKLQLLRQENVHYLDARRSLLFLDEFNRAPKDILDASLQLILDHRLHSHILPLIRGQETLIVAAINPANGDYGVQEFDPALLDRFVECDVEPDFKAWYAYSKQINSNKIVMDFLLDNQGKLHFTPKDGTKGASPRSWSRLGTYVDYVQKTNVPVSVDYIKGTVGSALAAQFISFYNSYSTSLSYGDLKKLIKKNLRKKGNPSLQELGEGIQDQIDQLDTIKRNEFAESFADEFVSMEQASDALPWLVYLHALPLENLSAVLKTLQAESTESFAKLVAFDKETTNKELLKKVTSKLKRTNT
jgi:hypothetical protein